MVVEEMHRVSGNLIESSLGERHGRRVELRRHSWEIPGRLSPQGEKLTAWGEEKEEHPWQGDWQEHRLLGKKGQGALRRRKEVSVAGADSVESTVGPEAGSVQRSHYLGPWTFGVWSTPCHSTLLESVLRSLALSSRVLFLSPEKP